MFMAKGVSSVILEFERYPLTQYFKGNKYAFDICNQSNQLAKDAIKVWQCLICLSTRVGVF